MLHQLDSFWIITLIRIIRIIIRRNKYKCKQLENKEIRKSGNNKEIKNVHLIGNRKYSCVYVCA